MSRIALKAWIPFALLAVLPTLCLALRLGIEGFPVAEYVLFRSDGEYLPQVLAFARGWWTGGPIPEFGVLNSSVPMTSFAWHGFWLAALGPAGLLFADATAHALLLVAFYSLGKSLVPDAKLVRLWVVGFLIVGLPAANLLFHAGFPNLYLLRFPRPMLTLPLQVFHLAAALKLLQGDGSRRNLVVLGLLSGLIFAMNPQSAQVAFLISGLAILTVAHGVTKSAARQAAVWGGATAFGALPLLLQLSTYKDLELRQRLGAEPITHIFATNPALTHGAAWAVVLAVVTLMCRFGRNRAPRALVALLFVVAAAVASACPLSNFLTRTSLQEYHYEELALDYLGPAWFLVGIVAFPRGRPSRAVGAMLTALVVLISMADAWRSNGLRLAHFRNHPSGPMPTNDGHYRADLHAALAAVARSARPGDDILTFDYLPRNYAVGFLGLRSATYHAIQSRAPTEVIERNFAAAANTVGSGSKSLDRLLTSTRFLYEMGHARYHVNSVYSLAPRSEYAEGTFDGLEPFGRATWKRFAMPESSREHFRQLQASVAPLTPAVILLLNDDQEAMLAPDPAQYELVERSITFRVYARRKPVGP